MNKTQNIALIKRVLQDAVKSINEAIGLLEGFLQEGSPKEGVKLQKFKEEAKKLSIIEPGKIIEGVFDGLKMVGPDGKTYPVPPNYASKSKLVEGDILKLTIQPDGSFIFKQINPIKRKRVIGTVFKKGDETLVKVGEKNYKVLQASATYYELKDGDQVTIIIPENRESTWAAIENVIKRTGDVLKENKENPEDNLEEIDSLDKNNLIEDGDKKVKSAG